MEKARTKFEAGRDMAFLAHRKPQLPQRRGIGLIALDIGQRGKVIAGLDAAEMSFEPAFERGSRAGVAERLGVSLICVKLDGFSRKHGGFRWQLAGLLKGRCQLARFDLAGFDVRLVKRIDAYHSTGDGRRNLEPEKLLAEMVLR